MQCWVRRVGSWFWVLRVGHTAQALRALQMLPLHWRIVVTRQGVAVLHTCSICCQACHAGHAYSVAPVSTALVASVYIEVCVA